MQKFFQYLMGNGIGMIIGFISTPIITRLISTTEMGKYSLFITVSSVISGITYFGFDQSFVRFYYAEDIKIRPNLLRKCLYVPMLSVMIICIFIASNYKYVTVYLGNEISFYATILINIYLLCYTINRFAMLQLRMSQNVKYYSILNVLQRLFYLVFSIIFYYIVWHDSYYTLLMGITISYVIITVMAIAFQKKVWLQTLCNFKIKTRTSMKQIVQYGWPFIFSTTMTVLFQSTDRIMLKQLSDYSQIGIYSGASSLLAVLTAIEGAFTTFWVPVAYKHFEDNPNDKSFFKNINQYVTVVMFLFGWGLLVFKDIIVLLLGENYRAAVYVFPFMIFMPIMYTISETTVMGINFEKKTYWHIVIAFIALITNYVCNLIFIPQYGAKGAAIATSLSYIVFFVCRTIISSHYYKVYYKIHKFIILGGLLYMLAFYSGFYSFNIQILVIGCVILIIGYFLFRETINDIFNYCLKYIAKKEKIEE